MTESPRPARGRRAAGIVCSVLLFISLLSFFSGRWYVKTFGNLGFDAILFTLNSMGGAASGLVKDYVIFALFPALAAAGVLGVLLFAFPRKSLILRFRGRRIFRLYPLRTWLCSLICPLLSIFLIYHAADITGLWTYLEKITHPTTLFETYYIDPGQAEISFPEEKRNLIYIYLESMETTFYSQEEGGALPSNVIPELYRLAEENTSFSVAESPTGYSSLSGMNWTVGSIVAQTSGVPLKTPPGIGGNEYGADGQFLPGLTTLSDILSREGYYQAFMCGSDGDFGGRKAYFLEHGTDTVLDYPAAVASGFLPPDYRQWWGFEDDKLFAWAREILPQLASQNQPFAFTMLTADTHHIGGYLCKDCPDTYAEQYENVYACSSRKTAEFVHWLQQQDFYENTTVIIVGDHPSMDQGYFTRNIPPDYQRHVYNCILNAPISTEHQRSRALCTADLFPTTLAALGCTIPGDRLGLGTNLYGQRPTLCEELGTGSVNEELQKYSPYYNRNFLQIPL